MSPYSRGLAVHRGVGADPAADAQSQLNILQQYFITVMTGVPPTAAATGDAQVARSSPRAINRR
jgi:hypothetical protein